MNLLTATANRKQTAKRPITRSPTLVSGSLGKSVATDPMKPETRYLIPSITLICDSMTRIAVAEEKALMMGTERNSKITPVVKEKRKLKLILYIISENIN